MGCNDNHDEELVFVRFSSPFPSNNQGGESGGSKAPNSYMNCMWKTVKLFGHILVSTPLSRCRRLGSKAGSALTGLGELELFQRTSTPGKHVLKNVTFAWGFEFFQL